MMSVAHAAFKRDRFILLTSLIIFCVIAWVYTVVAALQMGTADSQGLLLPAVQTMTPAHFIMLLVMWVIMMAAMMLPSASPMLLMYQTTLRRRFGTTCISGITDTTISTRTGLFALGYLTVWSIFSLVATLGQWALQDAALLNANMATDSHLLGGVILVAAGVFQFTPLKHACLHKCRSPLGFLMTQWREGSAGAFHMGLRHGIYCVGCCWALMCLLFVFGVMNLLWIMLLAIFVLVEKVVRTGPTLARLSGALLIAYGIFLGAAALG